ncbi:Translation Initiation Factor 5B [Gurleya vavrai]
MVMEELHNVLNSIQTSEIGVHVQASTLGSLEALLNFLKEKVPVSSISIGNLRKKDIIKASTMIEKKSVYALMLCFDIKVEKEMEELASEMGVKIFSANIIYHLLDSYEKYIKEHFEKKKEENKPVYPCKISIIEGNVWNKRSPIVMGVEVEGILTVGAVLTRSDGFVLGKVTSIENNKKVVLKSITGDKVAIKVETEETPRMLGRHFEESDVFYSKLTRSNIDVLKEFYKEDLSETDIKLIIDIKRIFEII